MGGSTRHRDARPGPGLCAAAGVGLLENHEGSTMAYLLTHFWPGGTVEEYNKTLAAVTEAAGGQRPENSMRLVPPRAGF